MDVSSSIGSAGIQESMSKATEAQSVMKKAEDVQEQQITKIIEDSSEQQKQMNAQKTGMGNSINLTA